MMWGNQLNKIACWGVLAALILYAHPVAAAAQPIDNTIYATLLKNYIANGKVNYKGLKSQETRLDAYLELLSVIDPDQLNRNDRFAFYINAYNAWTLKLILTHYPGIQSIKDAGGPLSSPWKKKIARINGDVITLDNIEHDILRPQFKDPRVHFAINCAARSCPPLADYPYSGDELEQQLSLQTRKFVNDAKSNYLDGDTLWVSRIFKWFGDDFNNGIIAFFLKYTQGDLGTDLRARKDRIAVKYLDYDWSLNGE